MTIYHDSLTRYHAVLYLLGVAWATSYEALYRTVVAQLKAGEQKCH